MKVLIINDFRPFGFGLKEVLKKQKHEVTWVIDLAETEGMIAITPGGERMSIAGEKFDLAIVDGNIAMVNGKNIGTLEGPAIVAALLKNGTTVCVGTSIIEALKEDMLKAGAVCALGHAALLTALVSSLLSVEDIVNKPLESAQRLASIEANLLNEELEPARKKADGVIMDHIAA